MNRELRGSLKRGVVEFVAIFLGVTLSFLADDWHERLEQRDRAVGVMEGIERDLTQDWPSCERARNTIPSRSPPVRGEFHADRPPDLSLTGAWTDLDGDRVALSRRAESGVGLLLEDPEDDSPTTRVELPEGSRLFVEDSPRTPCSSGPVDGASEDAL
ncbi:MAG: hypothetical protein PVI57_18130 [Gemmatimonadota bacterium]|jgi:hypothetical protein